MRCSLFASLAVLLAAVGVEAASVVIEVLPDHLESLDIPLTVEVEEGMEGASTLRAVVQTSDTVPREQLEAVLRIARGDRLVAWLAVERQDHRDSPVAEFQVTIASEYVADSYLEIQVSAFPMPSFRGYRLPLSKYMAPAKRAFWWWQR